MNYVTWKVYKGWLCVYFAAGCWHASRASNGDPISICTWPNWRSLKHEIDSRIALDA